MRQLRVVIGLTVLATLAACSLVGRRFIEPVVSFKSARITGLGVTGGSLEVELDIYNPNSYRLDGSRLTYTIMVDSVRFGDGEYNSKFQVEKGDTSTIVLPLRFDYAGIGTAGRQLINTGSVEYRVLGDITFGTPLGNMTRPYDQKGRFSTLGGRSQ
jgi:LEA14-like dessication related protein